MRLRDKSERRWAPLMWRVFLMAIVAALFMPVRPGLAGGAEAERIIDSVEKIYEAIDSISAAFVQETYSRALDETETSRGRVYFKKPGKMRWDYIEGDGDSIVSDGELLWVYQSELGQIIESPASAHSGNIAIRLLSGAGGLREEFTAALAGDGDGTYLLELVPKVSRPDIKSLRIEVGKKDSLIVSTTVIDPFGNETRVAFEDVETGLELPESLFELEAPEGSRVIRP